MNDKFPENWFLLVKVIVNMAVPPCATVTLDDDTEE
jgi:hypothetical protein